MDFAKPPSQEFARGSQTPHRISHWAQLVPKGGQLPTSFLTPKSQKNSSFITSRKRKIMTYPFYFPFLIKNGKITANFLIQKRIGKNSSYF